ncbi:endonuclease/exonuclease/phosphatase family protein [Rubripirellula amarantea]|uniref:endonuclease/exonuclease/phosphatase family protein n=1 Tax=Rubripirellula amarantea TaxID=2527999 RepID=UPI001F5E8ED8|nr:endonuclease/exonuclease/phosphatase family protein [Rubripirellula amarantea]
MPLLRFLGPLFTGTGIIGILFMAITGRIDLSAVDQWLGSGDVVVANPSSGSSGDALAGSAAKPVSIRLGEKPSETMRIATFNIQFFGPSKVADPNIMQTLAQIVSQFDVVAIQEVRNSQVQPVRALVDLIRASGGDYDFTVSESIGEGTYKEAYAFVFDRSRIALVPGSAYLVQDPGERMTREPMVASFQAITKPSDARRPFRFTLINAHTSPSEVAASAIGNEMDVLDDVFVSVRNYEYDMVGEEDAIMLGDLNVDTRNLRELGQIPNVVSIAGDIMTNTRGDKTYDHILIDRTQTREFTGAYGILDMKATFGISEEEAIKISDHQPLWAEFTMYEFSAQETVAARPSPLR